MNKLMGLGAAAVAAIAVALAGCGGGSAGGDGASPTPAPGNPVAVRQALDAAAAISANDTSRNPAAPFSALQSAGVPAVTVNSAPKVNFAVFSDGKVKSDLTLSNVTLAIAKLVPGSNGEPDQWVNYIYRKEIPNAGVGPSGKPALASALQAATDPKQGDAALAAAQLVYNPDGYYTYTFRADITNPNWTATSESVPYSINGVAYEPSRTHRVTIALNYVNTAGQTIRVNPYFDFTIDANGKSVPAGASQTRKMVDVAVCNTCHDKLSLHGNAYVDTQFCVMCHNPGSADANSGNVLTLSTMVHKIHAGRMLHENGEDYAIWGYFDIKYDYSEVGFPQPLRNCAKCHDGANAGTPQGDNWKSKPSKDACLSCHRSGASSAWSAMHVTTLKLGATVDAVPNSTCASCHGAGQPVGRRTRALGAGNGERRQLPGQDRKRHAEESRHGDHHGPADRQVRRREPGHGGRVRPARRLQRRRHHGFRRHRDPGLQHQLPLGRPDGSREVHRAAQQIRHVHDPGRRRDAGRHRPSTT